MSAYFSRFLPLFLDFVSIFERDGHRREFFHVLDVVGVDDLYRVIPQILKLVVVMVIVSNAFGIIPYVFFCLQVKEMVAELRRLENFFPVGKKLARAKARRVRNELGRGRECAVRHVKYGIRRIVIFIPYGKNDFRPDGKIFDSADRIRVPDLVPERNRPVYHFPHGVEEHRLAAYRDGPLQFFQVRKILHAGRCACRHQIGIYGLREKSRSKSETKNKTG